MFLLAAKRAVTSLVISASLDIQSLRKLLLGFVGIVSKMIFIPRRLRLWNPLCIQPGFDWLQRLTLHKGWYKLLVSSWNKIPVMFLLTDTKKKKVCYCWPQIWVLWWSLFTSSLGQLHHHYFHVDPNTYSICNCAQYVTLQKSFSHLTFSFFPTPPIQLKLGLQIGGRLLVATYQDQSNYLANQQQVLELAVSFTNYLSKLCKNVGPKPFNLLSQTHIIWRFFIQF
jgi:hypothetical protein